MKCEEDLLSPLHDSQFQWLKPLHCLTSYQLWSSNSSHCYFRVIGSGGKYLRWSDHCYEHITHFYILWLGVYSS